ncbi:MAG: sigma 54-interacting transcriptional regulator [Janthinobacterium lividum]
MSIVSVTTVSEAAAAMHPRLARAIDDAGGRSLRDGVVVIAAGEAQGSTGSKSLITVARSKRPCVTRDGRGGGLVEFGDADLRFAAAAIVALARGDTAALADPASIALAALAARVADRGITVLIGGATGTGKEVLARSIHAASPRRNAAFVAVNCAALPEAMLEALLFGHERGAFTGAGASAPGLFRAADGGTLLLDEIAELPLGLQAKLLRALQESEVLPIGATAPVKVDVRIIAAANRDLAAEVAAGRFRADLFYRIAVFPLATTPLVSRRADIVPIAAALWLRQGTTAWPTAAALARLEAHDWPGNVRELGNVLARAAVIAEGERIEARDIVFDATAVPPVAASLGGAIREREFDVISATLADCAGRRGETASRLGISERTLRYKLAAMSAGRLPAMTGMTMQ